MLIAKSFPGMDPIDSPIKTFRNSERPPMSPKNVTASVTVRCEIITSGPILIKIPARSPGKLD